MYNKKVLIDALKKLGSAKVPPNKKDIIYDPKGQLKYPGQNTRIPSGDITMQGVPYPVLGKPNVGQPQMMQPGQNYQFPGADYVDEFPQMRKGGRTKGLVSMPKPSKKGLLSKSYSRSLDATNKFFTQNYLFAKPKSRKNKVFDPNAKYYQEGGEQNCPEGYVFYNGQCVEWQEPEVIETDENTGYNAATGQISQDTRPGSIQNNGWWTEHEKYHHLQNLGGGASTAGFLGQRPNNTVASDQAIGNYYDRRNTELEAQTDAMIKADPNLQFIPRNKLQEFTEGFPGANALMYQDPTTEEGEARVREEQFEKDGKSMFPKKQDGSISKLEGDLISKVLMERNRGVDFVDRAFALGDNPGTPMFNLPDDEQFGQNMSHKMAWGEDDNGQAWMYPTIMNPNDEAIQVPNQYADYISSEGYKNATGMNQYAEGGSLLTKKVTCKKCGWKWDAEDGGNDVTTCHKCGGQGLVHAQHGGLHKFVGGGSTDWPPASKNKTYLTYSPFYGNSLTGQSSNMGYADNPFSDEKSDFFKVNTIRMPQSYIGLSGGADPYGKFNHNQGIMQKLGYDAYVGLPYNYDPNNTDYYSNTPSFGGRIRYNNTIDNRMLGIPWNKVFVEASGDYSQSDGLNGNFSVGTRFDGKKGNSRGYFEPHIGVSGSFGPHGIKPGAYSANALAQYQLLTQSNDIPDLEDDSVNMSDPAIQVLLSDIYNEGIENPLAKGKKQQGAMADIDLGFKTGFEWQPKWLTKRLPGSKIFGDLRYTAQPIRGMFVSGMGENSQSNYAGQMGDAIIQSSDQSETNKLAFSHQFTGGLGLKIPIGTVKDKINDIDFTRTRIPKDCRCPDGTIVDKLEDGSCPCDDHNEECPPCSDGSVPQRLKNGTCPCEEIIEVDEYARNPRWLKDGGALSKFVGGGLQNISPCQADEYWDGEKCVKRTINYYNANEDLTKNAEYQDWLIRQSLWQYSDLPYNKQKDLSSSIIRETDNYNKQLPYDFQGQVSDFYEDYPETEDFENNVNIGPYGSKTKFIESLTNAEAAKHSYRLISDNNEIVNNDVYKNTENFKPFDKSNAFFQKYPPSSWSYHSQLSSDPITELFSGNWNGSNFIYKKPNTSRIEDDVNRTYLKKFYPELTDEQIDKIVKDDVENPGYITNEFDVNKKRKWVSGQDAEGHDITKGQDIFKDENGLTGYKADGIAAYISQYDKYTPSWAEPKELWLKKEEELLNLPTLKPGLIQQQDYELQGADAYNEALENLEAPSYIPDTNINKHFGKKGSYKGPWLPSLSQWTPWYKNNKGRHHPIIKLGMKESTMVDPSTGKTVNKQFKKDRNIQEQSGYNRAYYEGSEDEEGNYIPGEIENAETENRRINFNHGQMGRKDKKAQEQYNLEYDEYEFKKKFPTLLDNLNITYKDYINQNTSKKQYGGALSKFVEGGAETSWPPKGWPPIGRYKGILDLVKKTPTISTFGNAIKFPSVNWTTPSIPTLQREFNVEQVLKNKNFFPNQNSFLNAVKNATVQEITPEIDATIEYRSGTTTKDQLIALSKTYRSWPEYRNEETINSIYDGLSSGKDMEMPMVLQFPNGNKRVFSGNTRMDAARQLGINPNVLMLNVPDMTKLANPWQIEVFPGLQYKSTMLNNPKGLWTQVAKDGTINVENALKNIEKESAGDVKVELLKETLGENIPKKMDFNLFRKKTQETIIPLETTIVDHSSNYNINKVGYPSASRNSFERALNFNNLEIAEIEKKIKDAPSSTKQLKVWDDANEKIRAMAYVSFDRPIYTAVGPNGLVQYFSTLEEAKQQEEITLRTLNEELKNSKDKSIATLTEMQDLPLENKTVIFSNKDLFGGGSDAHNNPPETLGHIHFLRDAEFPDILLATQIQSDPFQSKYYWKYNVNTETETIGSEILLKTKKIESINYLTAQELQNFNNGNTNYSKEQLDNYKLFTRSNLEEINILNNDINVLKERLEPIVKENTPNYKQKVLLDKNHKKRFFQEFLNYAANRGDVNYIAIPTVETSARIQNYAPLINQANLGPESKLLMDNTNSFEEFVKKSEEIHGDSFQNSTEHEQYLLKKGYELYKKNGNLDGLLNDKRNYKSKHGTVLGNYEEYIKIAKKLGLEIEDLIIKGRTYKKIVIPEDFLKGLGEIDAYRKGGETNKSIEIKLTSEEIKKYVDGGYVVEDLDNFQDGGTTDPPPWNPDYPTNFYEFKTLTPEEKAEEAQFREDYRKAGLTPYDRALEEEPQFADEAMNFVKGWHDSPMYNQMVLNSYNGQQKNADYLTKLRKENIAAIPPIEISNTSGTSDSGFLPAATSDSITGQVIVYPEGYGYGPSLYTHEYTHSSDKPRELYKWNHPSYVNKKKDTYKIPSWMVYEDPRFPKEPPVFHKRVMPKSDQMYISTHRGANWKDNENYKINKDSGFYTIRTDDELKQEMLGYEYPLDDFEDYKKAHISGTKDWIEMDKNQWKKFGHDYVSDPTEVRARLGEIRMNAKKEGLYDPYTEQITPEIFENYINKRREDDNWQPMKPIDELRIEFTDEEILYMLQNISENKNDSETDNEFDMQYSQYGGVADYQLGEEVDEDTMKRLKKLGYTFNKI